MTVDEMRAAMREIDESEYSEIAREPDVTLDTGNATAVVAVYLHVYRLANKVIVSTEGEAQNAEPVVFDGVNPSDEDILREYLADQEESNAG